MMKRAVWFVPLAAVGLVAACDEDSAPVDFVDASPEETGSSSSSGDVVRDAASEAAPSDSSRPQDASTDAPGDAADEPDAPPFQATTPALALTHQVVCALKSNGTVWCWGDNDAYGVGNGVTAPSPRFFPDPQPVVGPAGVGTLHDVVSIAAGNTHFCAARHDGTAWCWGSSDFGELGDGTASGRSAVPVQVQSASGGPLTDVRKVFAGGNVSCAIVGANATAHCWGANGSGQLGIGTPGGATPEAGIPGEDGMVPGSSPTARPVLSHDGRARMNRVSSLDVGAGHLCVSSSTVWGEYGESIGAGAVWCAGRNTLDQLGIGGDRYTPGFVAAVRTPRQDAWLSGTSQVALGWDHGCTSWSGHVTCWGHGPRGGAAGDPFDPAPPNWGWSYRVPNVTPLIGQLLADDAPGERDMPNGLIVANTGVTCVGVDVVDNADRDTVLSRGELRCMGTDAQGALGNGVSGGYQIAFNKVVAEDWSAANGNAMLQGVLTAAAGGGSNTCVVVESGRVLCWGQGEGVLMGVHDPSAQTSRNQPTAVQTAAGTPFNVLQ